MMAKVKAKKGASGSHGASETDERSWKRPSGERGKDAPASSRPAVPSDIVEILGADRVSRMETGCEGTVRLGLFGGAFDPLHAGHIACAMQARDAYDLSAVLFVPGGRPPWKLDVVEAPAQERFDECVARLARFKDFGVSDIELRSEGVSYTSVTVERVREELPAWVELWFIVASDVIASVPRWHDSDVLARLVTFCVVERPGYPLSDDVIERVRTKGFSVEAHASSLVDVSSSELRGAGLCGDDFHRKRLETAFDDVPSLLSVSNKDIRKELKGRVGKRRYRHCLGVMQCARRLAEVYGEDVELATLAGLLHDWDKGYDDDGIRERVRELGLPIDANVVEKMPYVLHGQTGAAALRIRFPDIPEAVTRAIALHTVAELDMRPLDMVVYIADALEPNRTFERAAELRRLVGRLDLTELFVEVYALWTELLLRKKRLLHPRTIEVWNAYASRGVVMRPVDYRK